MDSLRYDALTSLRTHKKKLPKYLWRVQHGDSQATFDPKCNLLAAINSRIPSSHYELRASLTRHLKWGYSRAQSHFISTFDSYHLAVEWARAKLPLASGVDEEDGEDMQIYRIRTAKLRDETMVFNVQRLVARLGIDVERVGLEREFVVLNMIPYKSLDFIETISTPTRNRPLSTSSIEPRSTPWRRTLQRKSQFFTPVKSPAVSNRLELLVSQHLERVQNEKQAAEVFCWVPVPEIEQVKFDDEDEEEEDPEREDSVIELREKLKSWLGES